MKHKLFFSFILLVFSVISLHGQNTFPSVGNVGIGTTSPSVDYKLDIRGGLSAVGGESRFSSGAFVDPWVGHAFAVKP